MSEHYQAPPGPPPSKRSRTSSRDQERASPNQHNSAPNRELATNNPFRGAQLGVPQEQHHSSEPTPDYEPPPGPPPGWQPKDIEMSSDGSDTLSGPSSRNEYYEPPPGPPPSHRQGQEQEPPPYDPWHGDDDTLHPPPSFAAAHRQKQSPTANASYDDAARAHAWCRQNHLWPPRSNDPRLAPRISAGDVRLTFPPNTTDITIYQPALGKTYIRTAPTLRDTILLSDIPIYTAQQHSPLSTGKPSTIYFELQVMAVGDRYNRNNEVESGISLGFVAPPYPAWRLPGWHRGSLGVHGDDGRRFVDDSTGGQDFVAPFKKGDVIGIGMTFEPPRHGDRVGMRAEVFFTRNGRREGGWDLHEERDRDVEEGDVTGLEGDYDLLAAVGVFGSVELETRFAKGDWQFTP